MELINNQDYTVKEVSQWFIKTPKGNDTTNYLNVLDLIRFKKLKAVNRNPRGMRPYYTVKGSAIIKYLEKN